MIDAHCHIDAYPNPLETALQVNRSRVLTIAVTNLPSDFERAYPHVCGLRYIRLAVGFHPLLAHAHPQERERFVRCLSLTSYVGEVGLDFSREGQATSAEQAESFRFVLQQVRCQPKFISLHSRRAESAVLDLLEDAGVSPVVFHWYSGSGAQLERLLGMGHFCSVNPAMLRSQKGRTVIDRLPQDRVLTETDGPFVAVSRRAVLPMDVADVERFLADRWARPVNEVRQQILDNLRRVVPATGVRHDTPPS